MLTYLLVWKDQQQQMELVQHFLCYYLGSDLVLSSTILNLESCLYARNTMKAIIRKSIIFEIKSPHMNLEFAIVDDIAFKSPDGRNNPINGVIMSVISAVTSLEAA